MAKANPVLAEERPDVVTRAYFAGLFDGEGSITVQIARVGPPPKHRRYVGVFLELGMTTPEPVIRLGFYYGGSIGTRSQVKPGHKPMTRWIAQSNAARLFLGEIGPYLHVKRAQAELAIELLTLSASPKRGQQTNDPGTARRKQDRINALRSLNGAPPVHFRGDTLRIEESQPTEER